MEKFNFVERIENTPFNIIENEEGKCFISMGNQIITEKHENRDELLKMIESKSWNFMVNVICATFNIMKQIEKNETTNETNNKKNND